MPDQAREAAGAEPLKDLAPPIAGPEPDEWITQPDTAPFDIGMPFLQQPDGAFSDTCRHGD